MKLILAGTPYGARKFCEEHKIIVDNEEVIVIASVRTLEGLRFRYRDVIRVPGWQTRDDIEEIEARILLTEVTMGELHKIVTDDNNIDWDIDANLPTYTRDYLRLINEGKLPDICTFGTVTH